MLRWRRRRNRRRRRRRLARFSSPCMDHAWNGREPQIKRRTYLLIELDDLTWTVRLYVPGAVDGGADGVGDADAALGGDVGGVAGVEAADTSGGALEAVAGGALVGGALGGGVEAPHAAAAGRGGTAARAAGVGEAGADRGAHLPARDGGLRGRRRRQQHRGHDGDRHELHAASHVDLSCVLSA